MNTLSHPLPPTLNLNALENQAIGASLDAWRNTLWGKILLTLSRAFPVPGDGMH